MASLKLKPSMKPGTRSYGAATLAVRVPTALPTYMRGSVREIVAVYVPEESRRQGLASELLTRTVAEAKRTLTVLMLTLEDQALEGFYARFGFQAIQRNPKILMVHP